MLPAPCGGIDSLLYIASKKKEVETMKRYEVNLYDKDNDVYCLILETDDREKAEQTCKAIALLFYNKDVILRRNDNKDEPFDWVEVYDNEQAHTILVNDIGN